MLLDLLPLFTGRKQDTTGSRYTAPQQTIRARSHHRLRLHPSITHDVSVTTSTRAAVQVIATHQPVTASRSVLVPVSDLAHLTHRTRVSDDDLALLLLAANRMEALA